MTRHIGMLQDAIDCRLKDVSPNGNVVVDIIVNYKSCCKADYLSALQQLHYAGCHNNIQS